VVSVDPPEKGKKYYSLLAASNHNFSRGTIVSRFSRFCGNGCRMTDGWIAFDN
jgi:hypothetical protein